MTLLDLIEKIKLFEGFRPTVYKDSGGLKTIGYGFTDKKYVSRSYISKQEADLILSKLVIDTYESVCIYMSNMGYSMNANMLYALTDFAYNLGMNNLKKLCKPSAFKRKRTLEEISNAIPLYCNCKGKPLAGLKKRRAWEKEVFNGRIS